MNMKYFSSKNKRTNKKVDFDLIYQKPLFKEEMY